MINFMLSRVEHEKKVYNLGARNHSMCTLTNSEIQNEMPQNAHNDNMGEQFVKTIIEYDKGIPPQSHTVDQSTAP